MIDRSSGAARSLASIVVVVDITSIGTTGGEVRDGAESLSPGFPIIDAQPLLEHALDIFGPARLMFASNFPMDKVTARLPDIVGGYATVVTSRGEAAVRAVFRDTALEFYGIA
jgi:hypothetical protein